MRSAITISKLNYKSETRVSVHHPFTGEQMSMLRSNKGATFLRTCAKLKLVKQTTPSILRHSFATHQLENAVDIRFIQELPICSIIKTTGKYTLVANATQAKIISPLDNLKLSENSLEKPP